MDIDLRTLRFKHVVNDNLICCICQTPFIEPVISRCGHTFCRYCIYQALEASPVCPIDRATLSLEEFQPAAKIISNMVNELLVYCPRHEQGCTHIGQRQYIESHLKNDCEYTITLCELDECKELLMKKDLGLHAETCKFRQVECNMCKKKLCAYELEDHYNKCPSEIIQCQHCKISRPRSEHTSHINHCPQMNIACPHNEFGCPWNDQRQHLTNHLINCPYESIKGFLNKQQQSEKTMRAELTQLHKENESLKRQYIESRHHIDQITHQLDLMFPGHFLSDILPEEVTRNGLSESQRMNNELETLSATIASLELKQNMALMTETFRLQEELQSLRAICHGLRMQMHYIMMDRKTNHTSSSVGSSSGNNASASRNDASNPTSTSLNRMRTYQDLLSPASRQETKL